jgi:hypothetical protein
MLRQASTGRPGLEFSSGRKGNECPSGTMSLSRRAAAVFAAVGFFVTVEKCPVSD